jgi:hypothetical protein
MDPKPWWQSRTLLINAAVIALTILLAVLHSLGIDPLTNPGPELQAWIVVVVSLVNIVLRLMTRQPLARA